MRGNISVFALLGIVVVLAILFVSFPYFQKDEVVCKPGQTNCANQGWNLSSPLYKLIVEQFSSKRSQAVQSTLTPDPTANWKTYTNSNPKYTISYPGDWIVDSSNATMSSSSGSVLLISKNGHTLKIYMPTGYGPGVCLFEDSPDFNKEMEGPYGKCPGNFTEFSGTQISYRRLDTPTTKDASVSWSVYTKDPSGSWVTVPIISYSAPLAFNANLVKTMDQILSTFRFLK